MSLEENKKQGYVLNYRSKIDWQWFKYPLTSHLFEYCILRANYKDSFVGNIEIKKGSFMTSIQKLSEATGLTIQQTRTALKNLQSTGDITIKPTNKFSLITVENYRLYQEINDNLTNKQQTNNKQITNKQQQINKGIKENKVVVVSDDTTNTTTTPFRFDDDFEKFWKAYRKKSNKRDTYEVWKNDVDKNDIELIVFAAKEYSKENENDRKSMMYSRTFLENECYLDYSKKFEKHKAFLREQEELEELRKKVKSGNYWND